MNYRGRHIDPLSLWGEFVNFPPNTEDTGGFSPLVQCPNPDHHTDKRHFQVNLDKPLVHCFAACGISGTYEHALSMILGVSEKDARKRITQHSRVSGLSSGSKRGRKARDRRGDGKGGSHDADGFVKQLEYETYCPQVATEYLRDRGIGAGDISRWSIGFDQDDRRIVIPAADLRGQIQFLIKRAIREKDWPKYLYAPEGVSKTAVLFGACNLDLKTVSSDGLILCEGSLDAIRLQGFGLQATAILGTGLSPQQKGVIDKVRPRRVYMMFDKDGAGARNVILAERRLKKVPLFVCLYPQGKNDPAELTQEEADRSIARAIPFVKFLERMPATFRADRLQLKMKEAKSVKRYAGSHRQ